jgi:hypothetical protein
LTTVVYFGHVMPGSIESLLAVAIDNIEDLQTEVTRNRDAIHKLQSITSAVSALRKAVEELQEQMPTLARQAAKEAVEEFMRRKRSETFANWRMYLAVGGFGVAVGAFIVSLVHG